MRLITPLPALVTGLALVGCGDKDTGTEVGGGAGVGSVGDTYVDEDGDGFLSVEDCDDADASTYPGAPESCDGIDNDCDGEVDENPADAPTFHADRDGDGFGDDATTEAACEAPDGFVEVGGDCDDEDPSAFPGNDEYCDGLDNDCDGDIDEPDAVDAGVWYGDGDADGYGDADRTQTSCDQPAGFVADDTDCNDQSDAAHPGASEACDGIDNDCNGETDEDASADAATWYADGDGDGFGDAAVSTVQCAQPTDYVLDATDCDDAVSTINPGASEYCDGLDNDCDGTIDEDDALDTSTFYGDGDGDGYGDAGDTMQACAAPSGYVADDSDCDDGSAAVNPGAAEVCNGVDDDCDAAIDDDDGGLDDSTATSWHDDSDGDGYGDPLDSVLSCDAPAGFIADDSDCDDGDAAVNPAATEVCNGADDDCDGATDDADTSVDASTGSLFYVDGDGDGYGDAASSVPACDAPSGYAASDDDCDDGNAAVNPGASEVCNTIDDDCDGDIDDADSSVDASTGSVFFADVDGDGFGDAASTVAACSLPASASTDDTDCDDTRATTYPGADEYCNTRDDDCDGDIDEDDALDALTWFEDVDGDGFGDATSSAAACNQPSGFVADDTDCDDGRGGVYPGATEICNSLDDDCDGAVDDADSDLDASTGITWYADIDGDGFGSLLSTIDACEAPASYVEDSSDCDDTSDENYPGADEYCDGDDNDCDGTTDEDDAVDAVTLYADDDGDGYGNSVASTTSCSTVSGYVTDGTDCNDADGSISPGTAEIWYDGIDSDCGSDSDYDADGDGYESESYTGTDCDDLDPDVSPAAAEVWYDGIDSDCDDASDYDADADGYESDSHGGDDCNDADAAVYPGVAEVWYDGVDADCDGAPDDDADGDGFDAATAGGDDCDDTDHMVHPYGFELPDGSDNDCDGLTDESAGTSLSLSDDDYDGVSFGFSFPFCGSTHSTVYIGSNGILFFTSPSGDYTETETEFLGTHGQSIAAFWDDLDPSSAGTVYYQDYGDAFGVFYEELPEYATSNSNTFSTVFFDDGTILQSWDGMASVDGMVGWSCGTGVAGAVDLSAEVDALEPHELYVGSGSEDSLYELFYSGSPLDLDGEMVWYTGAL